jgi:hypothetical protein
MGPRIALGDVVTRDYLRSELQRLERLDERGEREPTGGRER